MVQFHATTICAVRRGPDDVCIGGDGQVTMGETAIMKNGAKKVRKIYKNTVVSVMNYGEYNSSFWKWGTMSLSSMSAIADAKKDVLCYNDKAEDRNGNYTTKYADYVKAYISVDASDYEEGETNAVAEFIIVIVNGAENAALDA